MLAMNEFVDLRVQQHIAEEIYRHQIMQRIPDPFPPILPIPVPRHIVLSPRISLSGIKVSLQNNELWKQFHHIGTEMIITKSGRRMFPSMRLSISGMEEELNYCVLLEMVPIGDCRYKFSGSQWVPAGGAEPQSPQRMYLHTDSPASGSHWQAQPVLFNKVKLTNNTLDNNGHIVLASMHKYQPRIHIIQTSDPTQIPWSAQQAFVFPETEFVAVTAYQNDRITKLKIDNNPFAKGFRETGQSRCKRKMTSSPVQSVDLTAVVSISPGINIYETQPNEDDNESPSTKCIRSNDSTCSISSLDEVSFPTSISSGNSSGKNSPNIDSNTDTQSYFSFKPTLLNESVMNNQKSFISPFVVDLANSYFGRTHYPIHLYSAGTCEPPNEQMNTRIDYDNTLLIRPSISKRVKKTISYSPKIKSDMNTKTNKCNDFSISSILGSNS